jgi:hypothetical protein
MLSSFNQDWNLFIKFRISSECQIELIYIHPGYTCFTKIDMVKVTQVLMHQIQNF